MRGRGWTSSGSSKSRLAVGAIVCALGLALLAGGAGAVSGSDVLTTVAGNGTAGYAGDGGQATSAQLDNPRGIAVDASGNLYITDSTNNRVRKVTPAGTITTVAGTGVAGYSGDGGQATSAQLKDPYGIAVDGSGNLYIADSDNNRVRKVSSSGTITTIAGTGTAGFSGDGGQGTSAQLYSPVGIAVDGSGNVYIADTSNHRIRKVGTDGNITTVAGTGTAGFSGDGGQATSAQLYAPEDVAVDSSGNLFIADTVNNRIRKVTSGGTITTIAGTGTAGFSGDGGPATAAQLSGPYGLVVDKAGNVYVADTFNYRIRKITSAGTITTIAGTGTLGFAGDGGPAASSQMSLTVGVDLGQDGSLFFSDYSNQRARKIANAPPTASFTVTPQSGQAPLSVSFNGSASSDADGSIASYAWDFGDGQSGSGATATHAYTNAGTFSAKLTVTDDGGATASTTQSITVTAPPKPPPTPAALKLRLSGPTSQRPLTSKAVTVTVRCSKACTLSATGFITVAGTKVALTAAKGKRTAAGSVTLHLGLSKSARGRLGSLLKPGTTGRATITIRAGAAVHATRTVTIRR